jgi:hypothetical protein
MDVNRKRMPFLDFLGIHCRVVLSSRNYSTICSWGSTRICAGCPSCRPESDAGLPDAALAALVGHGTTGRRTWTELTNGSPNRAPLNRRVAWQAVAWPPRAGLAPSHARSGPTRTRRRCWRRCRNGGRADRGAGAVAGAGRRGRRDAMSGSARSATGSCPAAALVADGGVLLAAEIGDCSIRCVNLVVVREEMKTSCLTASASPRHRHFQAGRNGPYYLAPGIATDFRVVIPRGIETANSLIMSMSECFHNCVRYGLVVHGTHGRGDRIRSCWRSTMASRRKA